MLKQLTVDSEVLLLSNERYWGERLPFFPHPNLFIFNLKNQQ
jgi:hypothetical protein